MVVTPNPNWFGKETLTFTVKDPSGASASKTATFEVTPVNDPPTLKPVQPFVIEEKKQFQPFDFSKVVNDPDNKLDELKWTLDNDKPGAKEAPAKKGKKGKHVQHLR